MSQMKEERARHPLPGLGTVQRRKSGQIPLKSVHRHAALPTGPETLYRLHGVEAGFGWLPVAQCNEPT
jgi:hypothetical protein